jgi:hypothetical protein
MSKKITIEDLILCRWPEVEFVSNSTDKIIKVSWIEKTQNVAIESDVFGHPAIFEVLGFQPFKQKKLYTFSDLKKEEGTFAMINDRNSTIKISSGTFKFLYNNCLMYDISSRRFDDDQLYIKISH